MRNSFNPRYTGKSEQSFRFNKQPVPTAILHVRRGKGITTTSIHERDKLIMRILWIATLAGLGIALVGNAVLP